MIVRGKLFADSPVFVFRPVSFLLIVVAAIALQLCRRIYPKRVPSR
mgnify:CR=1 FL=1